MKKILTTLLLGLLATGAALAQNPYYEQFKAVRDAADTTAMDEMLRAWPREEPERYAAQAGYCVVQAELRDDPDWLDLAVRWAEDGLEIYPDNTLLLYKRGEALEEAGRHQEALETFLHICEVSDDQETAWMYLSDLSLLKNDFAGARTWSEKLTHSEEEGVREAANATLEDLDKWESMFESEQVVPDYDALRPFSRSPEYEDLIRRFEACDSTLTTRELSDLYYATSFRYNPQAKAVAIDEKVKELVSEERHQEAFDLLVATLREAPVSLGILFDAYWIAEALELDAETRASLAGRVFLLMDAISSSGHGQTPDCPVHVICVDDEYRYMTQGYGMKAFREQALTSGHLDRMVFVNGNGMDQVLYFALPPAYWEMLGGLK